MKDSSEGKAPTRTGKARRSRSRRRPASAAAAAEAATTTNEATSSVEAAAQAPIEPAGTTQAPRARRRGRPSKVEPAALVSPAKQPHQAKQPVTPKQPRAPKPAGEPARTRAATQSSSEVVEGLLRVNPRGFGFLCPTSGGDDLFCPPGTLGELLDGDVVRGRKVSDRATDLQLVKRRRTEVIGTVGEADGRLILELDEHIGQLDLPLTGKARVGETVIARLAGRKGSPARITERFSGGEEAMRGRVLVRNELPRVSPMEAADAKTQKLRSGMRRRDLRKVVTLTIDDEHSRDLDDALSVSPADEKGCVTLSVHIADVAEHITVGSALDLDAREVATSIYLHPWVRPMLDPRLSEQSLSLLPGQERDAITVDMRIDPEGEIHSVDIYESRICSDGRLDYHLASAALREEHTGIDESLHETLRWLRTASARLGFARSLRGGLSARFSDPELRGQSEARDLIERCMVAANESVARWMADRGLQGLWRTHDAPGPDEVQELDELMTRLGFHAGLSGAVTPRAMAALDAQVQHADDATVALWHATLERMGRARYVSAPGAHFGLGSECYTHFTSPIRRYADLIVHRAVKAHLRGDKSPHVDLDALAVHINDAAGRASRAESQLRSARRIEALSGSNRSVGGCVTSVSDSSVRIWLDGGVRAHLPVRALKGRFKRDGVCLVSGQKRICPGERISVKITKLDPITGIVEVRPR